jgi:hypothetical protein
VAIGPGAGRATGQPPHHQLSPLLLQQGARTSPSCRFDVLSAAQQLIAWTLQEAGRIMDLPLALILNQKVETKGRIEVHRLAPRPHTHFFLTLCETCRAGCCICSARTCAPCTSPSRRLRASHRFRSHAPPHTHAHTYTHTQHTTHNTHNLPRCNTQYPTLQTKKWIKQNIFPPKVTSLFAFKSGEPPAPALGFYDLHNVSCTYPPPGQAPDLA